MKSVRRTVRLGAKRVIDVATAGVALVGLSPLLAITALAVRMFLGTPVLFRQQRPRLNGKPFVMVKFRTMSSVTDASGNPLPDAARLGRFGRFLRSTSIDELPELLNVIRGDMSLVGPRPLLIQYLDRYTPRQARRHDVLPGITGWAQINGRKGLSHEERFELDVWYVENWSLGLDLQILVLTLLRVFERRGISAEGHVTMAEFLGTAAARVEA